MPTFQASAMEFFHKVPTTRISGWNDPRAFLRTNPLCRISELSQRCSLAFACRRDAASLYRRAVVKYSGGSAR